MPIVWKLRYFVFARHHPHCLSLNLNIYKFSTTTIPYGVTTVTITLHVAW